MAGASEEDGGGGKKRLGVGDHLWVSDEVEALCKRHKVALHALKG